jgi:hypothetical protein
MVVHSKDSTFTLTDVGTTERIVARVTAIDGLPGEAELIEDTPIAQAYRTHTRGLESGEFTVEGLWDDTANTGPDVVLGGLRTTDTASTYEFGPEGSESSDVRYTGTAKLRNYSIGVRVGEMVSWRATFVKQSAVTRDTFGA